MFTTRIAARSLLRLVHRCYACCCCGVYGKWKMGGWDTVRCERHHHRHRSHSGWGTGGKGGREGGGPGDVEKQILFCWRAKGKWLDKVNIHAHKQNRYIIWPDTVHRAFHILARLDFILCLRSLCVCLFGSAPATCVFARELFHSQLMRVKASTLLWWLWWRLLLGDCEFCLKYIYQWKFCFIRPDRVITAEALFMYVVYTRIYTRCIQTQTHHTHILYRSGRGNIRTTIYHNIVSVTVGGGSAIWMTHIICKFIFVFIFMCARTHR